MNSVLHINVESLASSLERAANVMQALEQSKKVKAQESIGFANVTGMLSLFTPKRWALIETLKSTGAMSIYALAKRLHRNYKNVHTDVSTLMAWGVLKKDENNLVYVPYSELVFDVKLSEKQAA